MSRTLLLVGTRKGCFVLESDGERRDWKLRGPLCESWPVYHAIHDAGSGAIYAAAASEWHGSAVWRSGDLGETWALSSEGLAYDEDGERKVSKVASLAATDGQLLVGVEAPGIFESRDGGESFSLLTTLAGQPGSEDVGRPGNQPPGHLGISAITPDRDDPTHFWAIVQGVGLFETHDGGDDVDAPQQGPARRLAASARGGRLLRPPHSCARPSTRAACTSRTTSACTAATTAATRGRRSPRACRASSASRPPTHPHDRDTFYVIPLDPDHARTHARGQGRGLAHEATPARAGTSSTAGCRSTRRTSACCAPR